jgi:protein-tyrosine phosphatase
VARSPWRRPWRPVRCHPWGIAATLHGVGGFRLQGAPNARDLGGLTGADGRRVRPGALLRAPALARLTEADVERLRHAGLVAVIDMRDRSEIDPQRPDRLPAGPEVIHIPIFEADHDVFAFVAAILHRQTVQVEPHVGDPVSAMRGVYRWLVSSPVARTGFARAVRVVAAAAGRPVLYHCSAGKDRTGWLSVILLTVLGVGPDAIAADYLRTNADAREVIEKAAAAVSRRWDLDPVRVAPLLAVAPEYLAAGYEEVERAYGTFDEYLSRGLGLDEPLLRDLRASLLE